MEDLLKLQYQLVQDGVQPGLEMSRRGGHLWIFFATPLLAAECRVYIHDLALRLDVPVKGSGLADGIEVFPKHDAIGPGDFGNAIRGPLGIHRGANRRFWFYGADYTLEAQIKYLNSLRKVTEEELRRFIAGKELPQSDLPARPTRSVSAGRQNGNGRPEFRILEHVGRVRKVGRNYVTLAGEEVLLPKRFREAIRAVTKAVNCIGCSHCHFVTAPKEEARAERIAQSSQGNHQNLSAGEVA